jgi:single-stranded-DNA-specific exonuclease
VTVDCGTTSIAPLAEAKTLGLDVVTIDHHQTDEVLPPVDALVNPNRQDDLSGLSHLAAVGLVFMTAVAVNRELRKRGFWHVLRPEPDLLDLLDLVALGTVADVVPLKGLNRAFVSKGLLAMRRREHVGLTALMDAARLTGPPECWHLGFLLGPRINAGGRIGRADLGVRLLLEADATEAAAMAAELDRLNRERQVIEQQTLAEAEAEALAALGIEEKGAVVVAAGHGWHPGVVGLVAARLKERFGRPAFAIALEPGGIGTGSGRSITGVDLGAAVRHAVSSGLLLKGGGHAMAAGVTISPEKLALFRAYLEESLHDAVEKARQEDSLLIDGAVSAAGATVAMLTDIARAGPFGAGHAEPVLAVPAHTLAYVEEVGQAHVRARLRAGDGTMLNAIAFRAAGKPLGNALIANRGRSVHTAGTLSIDRWDGQERVQFRLMDLAAVEPVAR